MAIRGATPQEWEALARLSLEDVRPCVCNSQLWTKPTKSNPQSAPAGTNFFKRPSRVYGDGKVAGISDWQAFHADHTDLKLWMGNTDHGAGLLGRAIHAVDIDVDTQDLADQIDGWVCERMPFDPPARIRGNSPRRLLLFRTNTPEESAQHMKLAHLVSESGDKVEWLFGKQFFVLAGTHKSGEKYQWDSGAPPALDKIPAIPIEDLDVLLRDFQERFALETTEHTATELPMPRGADQVDRSHMTYHTVIASEFYRETLADGSLAVICPWHAQHQSSGGAALDEDPTKTVFFPVGLAGIQDPGFRCMHEGHPSMNAWDFLRAIGYEPELQEFSPEESTPPAMGELVRGKGGVIQSSNTQLLIALQSGGAIGFELMYSAFHHRLKIKTRKGDPRPFKDTDYTRIAARLEAIGFVTPNKDRLRGVVATIAEDNEVDEAIDWINTIEWDGVDRFSTFGSKVLRVKDSEYIKAVTEYLFSGLAGRVLQPGVKADMALVLAGKQGCRKSTFVEALAPLPESFTTHDFSLNDADAARRLRGKLVVELDEMRGLSSRDEESIKSWLTRRNEEHVVKYMEFTKRYARRFICIGTTNHMKVFSDYTGNRRYLPIEVCKEGPNIDTEYVEKNRIQLWAQGKALFLDAGVRWKKAETLAVNELPKFTKLQAGEEAVKRLLQSSSELEYPLTTLNIVSGAFGLGLSSAHVQRKVSEVERIMPRLGYAERHGVWTFSFL